MARRRPPPAPPPRRRVWRITDAAPHGEFVDLDAPPPRASPEPAPAEEPTSSGGWVVSSVELKHGAEVDDGPDTVSDQLFDELFPPPPAPPPEDAGR